MKTINENYEHPKLVSKSRETHLGAASLAFRAGLDGALCHHRRFLWLHRVSVFKGADIFSRPFAVHFEPHFQFRLHANPVLSQKQSARRFRHPARYRNARLGDGGHLASREMGGTRQPTVSSLGSLRDSFATDNHVAELEIGVKISIQSQPSPKNHFTKPMRYPLKNWKKIKRGYKFGEKTFYSARHLGTDYLVPSGTPVFAPMNCEVMRAGNFPEGGNTIHVSFSKRGQGKLVMRCMHLSKMSAKGKYGAGEILGYTGNTGRLTKGPHLHLDLSRNKVMTKNFQNFTDPERFFDHSQHSMLRNRHFLSGADKK